MHRERIQVILGIHILKVDLRIRNFLHNSCSPVAEIKIKLCNGRMESTNNDIIVFDDQDRTVGNAAASYEMESIV